MWELCLILDFTIDLSFIHIRKLKINSGINHESCKIQNGSCTYSSILCSMNGDGKHLSLRAAFFCESFWTCSRDITLQHMKTGGDLSPDTFFRKAISSMFREEVWRVVLSLVIHISDYLLGESQYLLKVWFIKTCRPFWLFGEWHFRFDGEFWYFNNSFMNYETFSLCDSHFFLNYDTAKTRSFNEKENLILAMFWLNNFVTLFL